MSNQFAFFGRVLASLVFFFIALLAAYVLLGTFGPRSPAGELTIDIGWIPDVLKGIVGAFVGLIGGFGIGKAA